MNERSIVLDMAQEALPLTSEDWGDLNRVEEARPPSLRQFDQIPMRGADLLRQVKLIAPSFAGQRIAFVGDSDGTSLLLGLLSVRGGPRPGELHLLDFDARLLAAANRLARRHGFADILQTWHYNMFDPIPLLLKGSCDWFYTNPPYGQSNNGESARLFVARGGECVHADGHGGIVLPDDVSRPWTVGAMRATLEMLGSNGWSERLRYAAAHQYRLDDDPHLTSDLVVVDRTASEDALPLPYVGRRVMFEEIPHFYGRQTPQPYPRYVRADGTLDYNWDQQGEQNDERGYAVGRVA